MSNPKDGVDQILKEKLEAGSMTTEESTAVWSRIETELAEASPVPAVSPARKRTFRDLRVQLAVAAVAAVVLVTVVALAPWSGSDGDGKMSLTKLGSASAAEVLTLTAESAVDQPSLVPGPGEVLYSKLVNSMDVGAFETGVPAEESGRALETSVIEEWIGPDGKGVRLDGESGSSSMSNGVVEVSPLRLEFDASQKIDQKLPVATSWRSQFTLEQVYAIPDDVTAALSYIRRIVETRASVGGGATPHESDIVGIDFLALVSISNLLMEAPLSSEQRATLFEVLGQAPDWYKSEGSAEIQVTNKGEAETRKGLEGILIEADLKLNAVESAIIGSGRRKVRFGVLLDPESGKVLETQVGFGSMREPAVWNTSGALELTNRSEIPTD